MSLNGQKVLRWSSVCLLLLVVAFAGLNLLAYRQAYAMLHYSAAGVRTRNPEGLSVWRKLKVLACGVNIPRPHKQGNPSTVGMPFREVTISSTGTIQLGAWLCPKQGATNLVILFHGYASEKSSQLVEARQFYDLGCAVLMVDFRGSGQSSEAYTTVGYDEAEDVVAAVTFAREQFPGARIVLFGQSMGAAAVLRAVGQLGVKPDAIVLEAVFDTMLNTIRHRFEAMHLPSFPSAELLVYWGGQQMGFDGFAHNPADYATRVTCPTLLMHGTGDARVYVADARQVFERLAGPKQFVEFKTTGHESYVKRNRDEWRSAVGGVLLLDGRTVGRSDSRIVLPSDRYTVQPSN